MNPKEAKQDSHHDGERRDGRRSQDTPAWTPNDEVPANRREDSRRDDLDEECDHPERRAVNDAGGRPR
jgi:hypothetical protein